MTLMNNKILIGVFLFLIGITFLTNYYGSTDIGDYADSAKYFAGKYKADIRNSHSYLYGFINAPFVYLFNSFFFFKIISVISLIGIIFSVYFISNKNKKSFWLILLSPAVWYMAPWISPIQLASLCLLWAWYFIKRFDEEADYRHLILSGTILGLSWALWNTVLYFAIIMGLVYLWNKKLFYSVYWIIGLFIGLIPLFILDLYLYGFPFYTLIKTTASNLIATFLGGIYGSNSVGGGYSWIILLFFIASIPLSFWDKIRKEKISKDSIFIVLSLLVILSNPQIRYLICLIPLMIIYSRDKINGKVYRITIGIFVFLSLLVSLPYLLQIRYYDKDRIEGFEICTLLKEGVNITTSSPIYRLQNSLYEIENEYYNKKILVGPGPDSYAIAARYHWGDKIGKFVSLQDYEAFRTGDYILFERKFYLFPNFVDRRIAWIGGGIDINRYNDKDYPSIDESRDYINIKDLFLS